MHVELNLEGPVNAFYLRVIEEERENENTPFNQVIENFALGKSYAVLRNGITIEFDAVMDSDFPDTEKTTVKALICGGNKDVYFVEANNENKKFSYFIMTETGKTFDRL